MSDTSRTYAALITALANNSAGAITEQTLRDFVLSVREPIDSVDRRPTVADAFDEEFDTIGAFVNLNIASGATVTVANSALALLRPSTDTTDNMRGVVKACPAGAWTIVAKVSINCLGTSWQLFGLGVRRGGGTAPNAANTSTDKMAIAGPGYIPSTTTAPGVYSLKMATGSNVTGSAGMNTTNPFFRMASSGTVYVKIAFDGTDTLVWSVSNDGIGYVQYFSGSATTLLGGAPDSICLAMNNEAAADCVGVCQYVRRIA